MIDNPARIDYEGLVSDIKGIFRTSHVTMVGNSLALEVVSTPQGSEAFAVDICTAFAIDHTIYDECDVALNQLFGTSLYRSCHAIDLAETMRSWGDHNSNDVVKNLWAIMITVR